MNVTESRFKNRQLHMEDYLQMVSAEQKEYAEVFDYSKITEKSGVITDYWTNNLLELILRKDNLNMAYKRVKSNKGSGGIDGMQVDELLPYLRENQETLIQELRDGKYKPKNKKIPFVDRMFRLKVCFRLCCAQKSRDLDVLVKIHKFPDK